MSALHAAARTALGWVFIHSGADVLRNPETPATRAAPILSAFRSVAPVPLPDDVTLVRVNAATQVVAASALSLGLAPRLAAGVLIGSLVPTTAGGHRFWEFDDRAQRAQQRIHFNKNLGLLGGLLYVLATPRPHRSKEGSR